MFNKITAPVKSIKKEYIPILAVYFAAGFITLDAVTSAFFIKNKLSISASDLIGLSVWTQLPWTIKMVFGVLIDGVKLFGNNRKSYIILGSILSFIGGLMMVDLASGRLLGSFLTEYMHLLLSGLLMTSGAVIADVAADTLSIEIVEKNEQYQYNIGMIQVLSRIFISTGGLTAAFMTGFLASNFEASDVFLISSMVPAISLIGAFFTKSKDIQDTKVNKPILLGGLLFGLFCALSGSIFGDNAQLIVFLTSMIIINYMLWSIIKDMDIKVRNTFVISCIAIFLFRTVPGIGPGENWWMIESLKFDESFMGTLRVVSNVSALIVLWLLSDLISKSNIKVVMSVLVGLATILSLPTIGVYYGFHEIIGLSAKNVVLADSTLMAPLGSLSMILLGVLIAKNAPENKRAIYISLTASFMNMALVGGDLITQKLNQIFPITRNDFSNLGSLMIVSLSISTFLSIIGLCLLRGK